MRQFHRWVSIAAAAFLLHMSITGMLLAWFNISSNVRGAEGIPTASAELYMPQLMTGAFKIAAQAAPGAPIVSIRSRLSASGHPINLVIFAGEHRGRLAIDAINPPYVVSQSGSVASGGVAWDSHTLLKRLHRGDFIGDFHGRYMSIAAGLCLAFLLMSGITLYIDMLRKRRRAGRSGLFWS